MAQRLLCIDCGMPEKAALITALVLERPLCMPCLTERAGIAATDVEATLARIRRVLNVERDPQGRCRVCGTVGLVVSLSIPDRGENTLADRIRSKLDAGTLPCDFLGKIRTFPGSGQPCSACGGPILRAQTEYGLEAGDDTTFRLHEDCHELWEAKCRRRGWRP